MEKMPYRLELDVQTTSCSAPAAVSASAAISAPGAAVSASAATSDTTSSDWRATLPVLTGRTVRLRELQLSDAPALLAMLTTEEVARFISPPPSTIEGFERFIQWTQRQRAAGHYACFAVTVQGFDTAIGIFQVRQLDPTFETAEWGFAIGSEFWGTGVFLDSAEQVLTFAFETLGVHRLEARAAVRNGRGNGALVKVGAVQEGVLRRSFLRNGEYLDQILYSIVEDDWRASREYSPRGNIRGGRPITH